MKCEHLKEDPCGDFGSAEVVVTEYETGSYDGSGDALVLRGGQVEYWDLSHSSCWGPCEDGPQETMTLDAFKQQNGQATCSWSDAVAARFLELVT